MTFHSTYKYRIIPLSILLLSACGGGGETKKETTVVPAQTAYTITATSGDGGSITPASLTIVSGQSADFQLSVNEGYTIAQVTGCNGTLADTDYKTGNITADCTISATFTQIEAPVDTTAPTAKILYPWIISKTDADTIVVKGVASAVSGVAAVRVNGITAEINVDTLLNKTSSVNPLTMTKRALRKESTHNMERVSWQASIELSEVELDIIVETEDNLGNIEASDSVKVLSHNIPLAFSIDNINHRLIGSNGHNSMVTLDLATKEISKINITNINDGNMFNMNNTFEYVESQNTLIYNRTDEDSLTLYALDVNTGLISTLIRHELDARPTVVSMDFSQVENVLYLNLGYWGSQSESAKSHLLKYDFAANTVTSILNGFTSSGEAVYSEDIAYSDNGLIVFSSGSNQGLSNIVFDGSDLVTLTQPQDERMDKLAVDLTTNTAYQAGVDGVIKVDLATGDKSDLSLEEDNTELNLSYILGSTVLDLTQKNVLIAERETDLIMSVDMETGERAEFLSNGVGIGKKLASPRAITLDKENNKVYLVHDGVNGREAILAIDLATGNRTQISKIKTAQNDGDVYDMVLDSAAQQLYVLLSSNQSEIIRIDIATGSSTVLTSENTTTGINFISLTGMTLDKANNRLLATDGLLTALIGIDLTTGHSTLLSGANNSGSGEAFTSPRDVQLDVKFNRAFVLSDELGAVFSVDLATGNRELILDTCLNENQEDMLFSNPASLNRFYFNSSSRQLLIGARAMIAYNADNNACVASRGYSVPMDFILTDDNQILATGSSQLKLQDFESADSVIISK